MHVRGLDCYITINVLFYIVQPKNFAGQKSPSPNPPILVLQKYFAEQIFACPCGKDCHRLYVIINTRQKFHGTILSPMRTASEDGENFLQIKISGYVELRLYYHRLSELSPSTYPFPLPVSLFMGMKTSVASGNISCRLLCSVS